MGIIGCSQGPQRAVKLLQRQKSARHTVLGIEILIAHKPDQVSGGGSEEKMKQKSCTIVWTIFAVMLLASAHGSLLVQGEKNSGTEPEQQAQPPKPTQQIYITAERFSYTPSRIKIKKGTIVEIIAESEDTSHGFSIPVAGIEGTIPARGKGEMRLRFEAAESGSFIFECSRPCGAGHNTMRGVIIVED